MQHSQETEPKGLSVGQMYVRACVDDNENKDTWCVGNNMDLEKNMKHGRKLLDNRMDGR